MYTNYIVFNHQIDEKCYAKSKISTLTFVNYDRNSKTIHLNKGEIIMTTKINYKEEIIKKCQEAQNKSRVDVSNYLKTHNKIDIDTVKKIMKENYFPDSDKLPILVYGIGTNNICFVFDMFDIQIMLGDNYDFDVDDMHSIEEELSYLLNINIHRSKVELDNEEDI